MAERNGRRSWYSHATPIVAGGLVILGVSLAGISWWFFLLTGLGVFGPGVLREAGWLRDKDEFQRRAEQRAGYHSFLISGLMATLAIAYFRSGERGDAPAGEVAMLFLALLWFTWFLSSLISYWGPQKTAFRILLSFGLAWLAFIILSNSGSHWSGWTALLMQSLLVVPFFALCWSSARWPRSTGILLLVAAAFLFQFFGMFQRTNRNLISQGITFILFLGPLVASGLALLACRSSDDEADGELQSRIGSTVQ